MLILSRYEGDAVVLCDAADPSRVIATVTLMKVRGSTAFLGVEAPGLPIHRAEVRDALAASGACQLCRGRGTQIDAAGEPLPCPRCRGEGTP